MTREAFGYYTYGDIKGKTLMSNPSYGAYPLTDSHYVISKSAYCYIPTSFKDLTYTLKNTVSKNSVCYYHNLNKSANIHLYYKETDLTPSTPEYIKINEDSFYFSSNVNGYYEIKLEGQIVTHNVIINAQPETAITKINNTEQNTYIAVDTEDLNWEVSAEGYVPQSGEILNIRENKVLDITLLEAVLLTITCNIENATILINGIEGASQKVVKGEEITYVVSAPAYKTKTETLILNEDTVIEVELEKNIVNIVYPGTTLPSTVTTEGIGPSSSYAFYNTGSQLYSSKGSYNINSGSSVAYIRFRSPDEASQLSLSAYVSSEANYDYGRIYLNGSQIFSQSGTSNSWVTVTRDLTPNTDYELKLQYTKDGSGHRGSDRLFVSNITFSAFGD
jgi:hypothetical protein